jgi:lipopolysaccharide export system permease protein
MEQKLNTRPPLFSYYLAKFLAKEIVLSFFSGTSMFLLFMLMLQAIRLSEFLVVHQVALKDVGALSLYLMLSFLPIAVPIAFLFSVLMGVSRANSEGEILALQVNGISLAQIYRPLGVFSIFVSLFCLYTSLYTVPQGNRSFELLITKLGNERVMAALKPGVFQQAFSGLVLFAETMLPLRNEMKHVFIYDEREVEHPLAIAAQAGILRSDPARGTLTLRLTNGTIHLDQKGAEGVQQKIDFDVYDINLDASEHGDSWRDYSPPSFTYPQLKQRVEETVHDPPVHRQLAVELHRRFSLSFSCLVFSLLGFVIGLWTQKGIRSAAILLCLLVAVVYWVSYVGANALALSGWIAPWLGTWSPNFLFAGFAVLGYRKFSRP